MARRRQIYHLANSDHCTLQEFAQFFTVESAASIDIECLEDSQAFVFELRLLLKHHESDQELIDVHLIGRGQSIEQWPSVI